MKTLDQWLSEYSQSHQNLTNQKIHKFCVPAIFFSILGMLWSIPAGALNIALIALGVVMPFYILLGKRALMLVLPQILIYGALLYAWEQSPFKEQMFWACLGIFVVAWIGQFIGHKIEGKKPSFFKDLQFLLIGPLWIIKGSP
ncbi:hypothetical protein BDW_10605 [Bdellovibrio bacteriovorus W]|nr:hypothetical protein BDW_10605 [Bdellovibrio bacteriovorus W]